MLAGLTRVQSCPKAVICPTLMSSIGTLEIRSTVEQKEKIKGGIVSFWCLDPEFLDWIGTSLTSEI